MEYDPSKLQPRERYKMLASFVLPRPIAWVTCLGPTGVVNAAPYSFFNVFCEDPPLCMFAVNRRPDGRSKDTLTNIQRTGEFVVNIADEHLAHAMHEFERRLPARYRRARLSRAQARALAQGRGAAACRHALGDGVQGLEDRSTSTATAC